MNQWPRYSKTRYRYLGVSRLEQSVWRFVCLDWEGGGGSPSAPSVVGPIYRSKVEALADLNRYASDNGFDHEEIAR